MSIAPDLPTVFLWVLAAVLFGVAVVKGEGRLGEAFKATSKLLGMVVFRLPLALMLAGFLSQVMPSDLVGSSIGAETGLSGVVIASVVGGLVPSGPFVSFPIALTLFKSGAGMPQLIAFISGWGIFALHRILIYEWPLMGLRFTALRFAASGLVPPLTGLLAMALMEVY
ncbi:MAG: hypothetical protein QGF38_05485 [Rhodospirillales bacterium]|jgi:uncharacterized membrane protein YraQ (UPF0718 family)|nr:hypothetical protein [Rhodospirillales bacterium]